MAAHKPSLRESFALLGLPESASEDEVRKTYRLRARECHPDKNINDPEATRKFQELGEAYHRILSVGGDNEDESSSGIDPFVIFIQVIRRMQQQRFMRQMFYGQFGYDDGDDDFGIPFGRFGAFNPFFHDFAATTEDPHFAGRHSRYSKQAGQSGFYSSSWRSNQHRHSQGDPSFSRARTSRGGSDSSRTNKHKKAHSPGGYKDKPKEPKRGGNQWRQWKETRSSTPPQDSERGSSPEEGYSTNEKTNMDGKDRDKNGTNEWNFPEEGETAGSSASTRNGGQMSGGSTGNSSDKDHSFTEVEREGPLPVSISKARPIPFPQVKPKKKSKKQQREEEWRRQREIAKELEKVNGDKEGTASDGQTTESAFHERQDFSKREGSPAADPSLMKQHKQPTSCSTDAVYEQRTETEKASTQLPPALHQEELDKDQSQGDEKGDSTFTEQRRNKSCNKAKKEAEGDRVEREEQTQQNEIEKEEQRRETAEPASKGLVNGIALHEKLQKSSQSQDASPEGGNLKQNLSQDNNRLGVTYPAANGQYQKKKNRNRKKKTKGITVETDTQTEQLQNKNEQERQKVEKEAASTGTTLNHATHQDVTASTSSGQSEKSHNKKKNVDQGLGMDAAQKQSKRSQNQKEKQEVTRKPTGKEEASNNVTLHQKPQTSFQHGDKKPLSEIRKQRTKDGYRGVKAKSAATKMSASDRGDKKFFKADRSKLKSRTTDYNAQDFPSTPSEGCGTHSYRHAQQSPSENKERGWDHTPQQSTSASSPEKDWAKIPQAYRKPHIESNDTRQWKTVDKRKARRERKWTREYDHCAFDGESAVPEADFWENVKTPKVRHVTPADEREEQRQLEIALELSKQQFEREQRDRAQVC